MARNWAQEEVQHGRALGHWACLADPDFDAESAYARFIAGYRLDLEPSQSLEREKVGRLRRVLVALARIFESEDDELAYAHFAANAKAEETYERQRHADFMLGVSYSHYKRKHVDREVAMSLKTAGLDPQAAWAPWASRPAYRLVRRRGAKTAQALAA